MEIKARLKTIGSNEVNAVLLNDSGEEYPVFLKSLHNTIIFPALIESGYKLTGLPYGFIKDGVELNQLPIQSYECTEQEVEMMYNSIGVPVSQEELKKHIDITEVKGMAEPPTNYTIFTREDLLQYLDAYATAELDDDYMPLNYFVAPAARFSIKEYTSQEYDKYVKIISSRREMTLQKFYKLVEALKGFGLPANYTVSDVLDAYFAWGMDGLDFKMVNRTRISSPMKLSANQSLSVPIKTTTYGFVDAAQNLFTPLDQRSTPWVADANTPELLDAVTRGMQMNDTKLMKFTANSRTDITTLEGTVFNIRYNDEILVMQQRYYPSLRVKSPVNVGEFLDLKLALPINKEPMYEDALLHAMASILYKKRMPRVKVSTYDALTSSGLNPRTALAYVTTALNMNRESGGVSAKAMADPTYDIITVDDDDINAYLSGDWSHLTEEAKSIIEDIIDGVLSIDHIGDAKELDASTGASESNLYYELYAVRHVMGLSMEDIMNNIRAAGDKDDYVIFSNGTMQHKISIKPSTNQLNGYMADLRDYNIQNAEDCTFFTYITLVAKEVGDERANRHVGIEFYFANRAKKAVKEIVDDLIAQLETRVANSIPDANRQAALLRMKVPFALNRYFEIAMNGTITWPKDLGGATEPVPVALRQKAMSTLERRIENLVMFCDFTANPVSLTNIKFNAYCTNAIITPERIIPRTGCKIHEVPFYAAWYDWRSNNPDLWAQMVSMGVLSPDFIAWELRYAQEQFVQRDITRLDEKDTLMYYYNHAVSELDDYPADLDFIAIEHPLQYMYPGLFMDDDGEFNPYADCAKLPVAREGKPIVRLGLHKMITEDDYKQFLRPTQILEEPSTYIRRFTGFDAETLLAVPDALEKLPSGGTPIVVQERLQSIFVSDTKQTISYHRINELLDGRYPVVHIYNRTYILRSADGKLWEVRV